MSVRTAPPAGSRRAPRRRRGPAAALLGLAGVVVAVAVLGLVGARALDALRDGDPKDYPGPGSGSVEVAVEPGDSASVIARTLADADVVASAEAFVEAAQADERSRGIKPGTYVMMTKMSAAGALARMLDPASRVDSVVTLPEGMRLSAALDLVARSTRFTPRQLREAASDLSGLGLPAWAREGGSVEGFLFPAQYDVGPSQDARDLLRTMVGRFVETAERIDLVQRARARNLDPYDVVVVASLVEAEVPPADYAKAARVIYNRLGIGMRLRIDATVNYALDRSTTSVSHADLQVDSPYNTYRREGLPPTPIGSPGEAALEAALAPAEGDWLFWVTTDLDTGETKFAVTEEEFFRLKAELDAHRSGR